MPRCSRRRPTTGWQCKNEAAWDSLLCERCQATARRNTRTRDAKAKGYAAANEWLRQSLVLNIEYRAAISRLTAELSFERAKTAPPS